MKWRARLPSPLALLPPTPEPAAPERSHPPQPFPCTTHEPALSTGETPFTQQLGNSRASDRTRPLVSCGPGGVCFLIPFPSGEATQGKARQGPIRGRARCRTVERPQTSRARFQARQRGKQLAWLDLFSPGLACEGEGEGWRNRLEWGGFLLWWLLRWIEVGLFLGGGSDFFRSRGVRRWWWVGVFWVCGPWC